MECGRPEDAGEFVRLRRLMFTTMGSAALDNGWEEAAKAWSIGCSPAGISENFLPEPCGQKTRFVSQVDSTLVRMKVESSTRGADAVAGVSGATRKASGGGVSTSTDYGRPRGRSRTGSGTGIAEDDAKAQAAGLGESAGGAQSTVWPLTGSDDHESVGGRARKSEPATGLIADGRWVGRFTGWPQWTVPWLTSCDPSLMPVRWMAYRPPG